MHIYIRVYDRQMKRELTREIGIEIKYLTQLYLSVADALISIVKGYAFLIRPESYNENKCD